jgi:hypothetical protein
LADIIGYQFVAYPGIVHLKNQFIGNDLIGIVDNTENCDIRSP